MSLKIEVKDISGKATGSIDLPAEIFDVQANVPLIHQVVVAQLAAARAGTHKAENPGNLVLQLYPETLESLDTLESLVS